MEAPAKPIQMVFAIRAMWAMLATNGIIFIAVAVIGQSGRQSLLAFHYIIAAVVVWLIASFIRAASIGKKWARNAYAALAALAIYHAVLSALHSSTPPALVLAESALVAAYVGILVCLFHPKSTAWFRASTTAAATSTAAETAGLIRKPIQINIAVGLMSLVLVLNAVQMLGLFGVRNTSAPSFGSLRFLVLLVFFSSIGLLIYYVSAGHNWARVTYALFAGAAAFVTMFGFVRPDRTAFDTILVWTNVISVLVILGLLFTSSTNAWFARRVAERVLKKQTG